MSIRGLAGILPTPLDDAGAVDLAGVGVLVDRAVASGLDAVVVLGSNGEFPYLSFDDEVAVTGAAVEASAGRIPVVGSASATSTPGAIALAHAASDAGCDAVMAALTTYFVVETDAAVTHVERLAADGGLPVYFYHYPAVTGLELTVGELARIAAIEGVVGAKITVVNGPYLESVCAATAELDFDVFTGSCFLLSTCHGAGGAGAFCPVPLVAPELTRRLWQALEAGEPAEELQRQVRRLIPVMSGIDAPGDALAAGFEATSFGEYAGPGPRSAPKQHLLKEALRQLGVPITATVVAPNPQVTPEQADLVARNLRDCGLLD